MGYQSRRLMTSGRQTSISAHLDTVDGSEAVRGRVGSLGGMSTTLLMTSPETWNMLGIPTGAHDGHLTGANPTISGQLWVITPQDGYGLWGITGLWVIPCKPTRDQPKSMAYHGLWVLACMG